MREANHTVVTRSTSTYRTESSLGQQITSFSSNMAVSEERLFRRCWRAERRLRHERAIAICERNIFRSLQNGIKDYEIAYSSATLLLIKIADYMRKIIYRG